jgi:hypothetical protein
MMIGFYLEIDMQEQAQETTPTDTRPSEAFYADAVRKGKDANAVITSKQWILGDLALEVTKVYGENRLERYAEDINFPGAACTLGRYRSVCVAFPKTGARPRFFASGKILATHPDHIAIVERNPTISKAEAREKMRKWREAHPNNNTNNDDDDNRDDDDNDDTDANNHGDVIVNNHGDDNKSKEGEKAEDTPGKGKGNGNGKSKGKPKPKPNDEEARLKETRRVCNTFFDLVNAVPDAAADVMKEEPSDLLKVVEPRLVKNARERCEKVLTDLCDPLDQLFAEAAEKLEQEGSVRTSPKPADEARQAEV